MKMFRQKLLTTALVFIAMVIGTMLYSGLGTVLGRSAVEPTSIWPEQKLYQKVDSILVVADQRLFTTMAIFTAVYNYGQDANSESGQLRIKLKAELDKRLKSVPADKVKAWKNYYKKHNLHIWYYVDYTMSLSQYPFKPVLSKPEEGNWFTRLFNRTTPKGFEQIMNDFWKSMNLASLWKSTLPDYLAEVKKYDMDRIVKEEGYVWKYLKMPKTVQNRYLVTVPNLLDVNYSAFASEYPGYYYAISSPGSNGYGLNIHEYLHGAISTFVEQNYKKYAKTLDTYFKAGQKNAIVKKNYNSLEGFVEENLVRAMDLRIGYTNQLYSRQQVIDSITRQISQGFTLLRVFYDLLQEFEEEDIPFNRYLSTIFEIIPNYTLQ